MKLLLFALLAAAAHASSRQARLYASGMVQELAPADDAAKTSVNAKTGHNARNVKDVFEELYPATQVTKISNILERAPTKGLSTAMITCLNLVMIYFIVQTIIKVIETKIEMRSSMATLGIMGPEDSGGPVADAESGESSAYGSLMEGGKKATAILSGFFSLQSMTAMQGTMSLVPMLALLIMFARFRAVNNLFTDPQPWAKGFFTCTWISIYIQTFSVVVFPKSGTGACYWVGKALDWVTTFILYVSVIGIIASICLLRLCENPESKMQAVNCGLAYSNGMSLAKQMIDMASLK